MDFIKSLLSNPETIKEAHAFFVTIGGLGLALLGLIYNYVSLKMQSRMSSKQISSNREIEVMKLKCQVVSTERLHWINHINGLFIELTSFFDEMLYEFSEYTDYNPELYEKLFNLAKQIAIKSESIKYSLNPVTESHKKCNEIVDEIIGKFQLITDKIEVHLVHGNDFPDFGSLLIEIKTLRPLLTDCVAVIGWEAREQVEKSFDEGH